MKAIAKKNMILFLSGKFVSLLGTNIYSFAMGLYILKVTGSAMNFALTMLLATVPRLILGPIAGVIADKVNRKKMVLISDFSSGLIMFLAYICSLIFGLNLAIIYTSTVLLTCMNTLFSVTFDASLRNLIDDDDLNKIQSLDQSIMSLTNILGPILGGLIYIAIPKQMFLLINGISFILSTLSETFIDFNWKVEDVNQDTLEPNTNFLQEMQEGYSYLIKDKKLVLLFRSAIFMNFFFTALVVTIPYILVINLKVSDNSFGIIESMFAVGTLVFSIVLSQRKSTDFEFNKLILCFYAVSALVLLLGIPILPLNVAVLTNYIPVYYGFNYFILGGLLCAINIPIMVYIHKNTDNQYRGRIMGFLGTISAAITPIGFLVHGLLVDYLPVYIIIIYVSLSLLIVTLLLHKKFNSQKLQEKQICTE